MRFDIERDLAIAAFKAVGKIKISTLLVPNMDKVLVSATDDAVAVQSTNLTQIVSASVEAAHVTETGSAVFPSAQLMVAFLSSLPDGAVSFDVSESTLVVKSGPTQMVRSLVPTKDYPTLPDMDVISTWHQVPTGLFARDLSAVLPVAVRASDPQYTQVVVTGNVLVASDGVSAHVQQASGYQCPDLSLSAASAQLLRSLVLSGEAEFTEIGLGKNAVLFRAHGIVLLAYTPTATLPDVNTTLVATSFDNDQILELDRDEFARAVAQVRGTVDSFAAIHVQVHEGGSVNISSKSQVGRTDTTLAGSFEHPDQEFILNAPALSDMLACCPQQTCRIFLGSMPNKPKAKDISPVRVSANDGEGGSFVSVMSQLRKDLL